jgi:hypothetical protein
VALAHQLCRLDALPGEVGGHPDVGDDHLWVGRDGTLDQFVIVGSDADDVEVVLEVEEGLDALAHDEVVVGQEHRDRHRSPPESLCQISHEFLTQGMVRAPESRWC